MMGPSLGRRGGDWGIAATVTDRYEQPERWSRLRYVLEYIKQLTTPCKCGWFAHTSWPQSPHDRMQEAAKAMGEGLAAKIEADILELFRES